VCSSCPSSACSVTDHTRARDQLTAANEKRLSEAFKARLRHLERELLAMRTKRQAELEQRNDTENLRLSAFIKRGVVCADGHKEEAFLELETQALPSAPKAAVKAARAALKNMPKPKQLKQAVQKAWKRTVAKRQTVSLACQSAR
jgi:hypothetical protein